MYAPETIDSTEALLAGAPEDDPEDAPVSSPAATRTVLGEVGVVAGILAFLGVIGLAIALGVLWSDVNHDNAHSIDLVCNRGLNTGLNLPLCPNVPDVDGIPLLSGDADDPDTVYALRAHEGLGINLTHVPNSHVQVSTRIESLSELIVLDRAGDSNTLTVNFIPNLINLSDACDISCDANFFMRLVNGADGYGFALGTDHIFANDNTHRTSAILGGRENEITMANGSVIVGGRFNVIRNTRCAMIGVGRNNTVLNQRSVIVIGEYNTIMSDDSFIGSGQMNTIISQFEGNAIVAGSQNVVTNSSRSIIGSGEENLVDLSDDSGIYAGRGNTVFNSTASIVGAGEENAVESSANSAVLAGLSNLVRNSLSSVVVAGETNVIENGWAVFVGAGYNNQVLLATSDSNYDCAIVAGTENTIEGYIQSSIIGAGLFNTIEGDNVRGAAILAGQNNLILGDSVEHAMIGVGQGNSVRGRVRRVAILAGLDNTIGQFNASYVENAVILGGTSNVILGDTGDFYNFALRNVLIGAGYQNFVYYGSASAIVAGENNNITFGTAIFIGAGQYNYITTEHSTYGNAIVAGLNNTVLGGVWYSFIGSGKYNLISDNHNLAGLNDCMIGAGQNNTILGDSNGLVVGGQTAVVVGSDNYVYSSLRAIVGAGSDNFMSFATSAAIVAGSGNVIERTQVTLDDTNLPRSVSSAIVAGDGNVVRDTDASVIGAGDGNLLVNSTGVCVVAGTANTIADSEQSAIIAGLGNTLTNSVSSLVGTGESNSIVSGSWCVIVAGQYNNIYNGSLAAFLGAGYDNDINNVQSAAIVAGHYNALRSTVDSFIGAGQVNRIFGGDPSAHSSNAIVAGFDNIIFNTARSMIGVGDGNTIGGRVINAFIGAGSSLSILESGGDDLSNSAIVAGSDSTITFVGASFSVTGVLVGAGNMNTVTDSEHSAIVAGRAGNVVNMSAAFIGAGNGNSVLGGGGLGSSACAIVAGINNLVVDSTGAFILVGNASTVSGSLYAGVLAGDSVTVEDVEYATVIAASPGFAISGALDSFTGHASNLHTAGSWRTSGVTVISGDMNFGIGDHLLLGNAVTATVHLPGDGDAPDGMQLRFRDVADASMAPVTLSCATSGCNLQPPNAASSAGGTDLLNTQYVTRFYVYYAATDTWIAF